MSRPTPFAPRGRRGHGLLAPLAIVLGAGLGTAARAGLESAAPTAHGGWPTTTLLVNAVGALVLGVLLQWLTRTGPDVGARRVLRLGVGTGLLGGFTTYSTFAMETVQLLRADAVLLAADYVLASLVLGVVCAAAGLAIGARLPVPARQGGRA